MLEIEQKYRIENTQEWLAKLIDLGFVAGTLERQSDTYLAHPSRDFGVSGEALRLRQIDDDVFVTYKGKKLAGAVKIRTEIELPLGGDFEDWLKLWQHLGFKVVERIGKVRQNFSSRKHPGMTICVDSVEELGCFIEIEMVVSSDVDPEFPSTAIQNLAAELDLSQLEPRSYLRQFLQLKQAK